MPNGPTEEVDARVAAFRQALAASEGLCSPPCAAALATVHCSRTTVRGDRFSQFRSSLNEGPYRLCLHVLKVWTIQARVVSAFLKTLLTR